MDTNVEDKMLHQIEKNLSNNINENLFTSGRVYDNQRSYDRNEPTDSASARERKGNSYDTPVESTGATNPFPQLSRAEYIRQAREACLRQLGSMPQGTKSMDNSSADTDLFPPILKSKKNKLVKLFPEMTEEDTEKEMASYRSLIIRTICCIVIFLSVFIIDKLKVEWGDFSHETVKNFITGNDTMVKLEEIIVSWLK